MWDSTNGRMRVTTARQVVVGGWPGREDGLSRGKKELVGRMEMCCIWIVVGLVERTPRTTQQNAKHVNFMVSQLYLSKPRAKGDPISDCSFLRLPFNKYRVGRKGEEWDAMEEGAAAQEGQRGAGGSLTDDRSRPDPTLRRNRNITYRWGQQGGGRRRTPTLSLPAPGLQMSPPPSDGPAVESSWSVVCGEGYRQGWAQEPDVPVPIPPVSLWKVTETHSDSASLPVRDGQ